MIETNPGKVSIVIPCYNHGGLLRETLESVERVRNANLGEVIIVDDGSTDGETCRLFEELHDSAYTIFHQSNKGLAAARNSGIKLAKGEFILPLDSDNLLRSPYLVQAVDLLKKDSNVDVVYADLNYFGDKTGGLSPPDFDLPLLLEGNFIDACALYRRTLWEEVGGYDEEMPWQGWEDWDFWMRAAFAGGGFAHLKEIGLDYRCRNGSMISTTKLHKKELTDYVFSKKWRSSAKLLRETSLELKRLRERCAVLEKSPMARLADFVKRVLRGPGQVSKAP